MAKLLTIEHLSVGIASSKGKVQAVRDVSFSLNAGEVLAIVGESGCGKSVLCKAIMRLLPKSAAIESGRIVANGTDITNYSEREMQALRGKFFSFVFQDPMTALNPTIPVGRQIAEAICVHEPKLPKKEVYRRVIELMEVVGIRRPQERYHLYPHDFSGGMRQRAVMAIALAADPKVLIADEPTGNLDPEPSWGIVHLLEEINNFGTTILVTTHDEKLVNQLRRRVITLCHG